MPQPISNSFDDVAVMKQVLALASQGLATTQPNPRVGCIIIKDDKIVGEGWHVKAGQAHAERDALKKAGDLARGGTAYVNLEPCCHQGRTPPCADALIAAGVSKVVIAMRDPNPLVAGGGIEQLRSAGIDVVENILTDEAVWLNRGFVSRMRRNTPWLTLKIAATLDGRTAAHDGESQWITDQQSRTAVHELRATSSAILTGIGTVLSDDPSMTVRLAEPTERQPFRVVLDTNLKLPIDAKIIGDDGQLIVFTQSKDIEKIAALTEMDIEVIQHDQESDGRLNLSKVMHDLAKWQFNDVFLEAGQTLNGAFLESGLVDELILFYAGSIMGDHGKSMFSFDAPLNFHDRYQYKISDACKVGDDFKVTAIKEGAVNSLSDGV